jgi:1-acyl-sn-glycerol-3-phosphate acyltransferase
MNVSRNGADLPPPWPRPVAWLLLQALLLLLGLMSALWAPLALLLYPVLSAETGRRLGRAVVARGYTFYWRVTAASGLMQLHAQALDVLRDEPGLVVVANHPSLLDAMMLAAHLPRGACIMKASLMRNPLLGPGAAMARYIRNDSAWGMVQRAIDELRCGGQLLLFPEGTRTPRAGLNPFHGSFTLIAKRAQAPIQAVFIDTDSPYLGKGWPLWRLPPLPIRFDVRLGRRFAPAQDHEALCREIEAYFAAGVRGRVADA